MADHLIQRADIICQETTDFATEPLTETKENLYIFFTQYGEKSYCFTKSDLQNVMDGSNVGVWIDGYRRNVYVFKIPYIDVWVKKFPIPDETSIFYLYKAFVSELGTQFGINRMHGGADYTVYKVYPINKERFESYIIDNVLDLSELRREVTNELVESGEVFLSKEEFIRKYMNDPESENNIQIHNELREQREMNEEIRQFEQQLAREEMAHRMERGINDEILEENEHDNTTEPTHIIDSVRTVGTFLNSNNIVYESGEQWLIIFNAVTEHRIKEIRYNRISKFLVPVSNDYVAILDDENKLQRWNVNYNTITILYNFRPIGTIIAYYENNNILIASENKIMEYNIVSDEIVRTLELEDVLSINKIIYKNNKIGLLVDGNRAKLIIDFETINTLNGIGEDILGDLQHSNGIILDIRFIATNIVVIADNIVFFYDNNFVLNGQMNTILQSINEFSNIPYYIESTNDVNNTLYLRIFNNINPNFSFQEFTVNRGKILLLNNMFAVLTLNNILYIYNPQLANVLLPYNMILDSSSFCYDNGKFGLLSQMPPPSNLKSIRLETMMVINRIEDAPRPPTTRINNNIDSKIVYSARGIIYRSGTTLYLCNPGHAARQLHQNCDFFMIVPGGTKCLIFTTSTGTVTCLNIQRGNELWRSNYFNIYYVISPDETKYIRFDNTIGHIHNMDTNRLMRQIYVEDGHFASKGIFYDRDIFIYPYENYLIFITCSTDRHTEFALSSGGNITNFDINMKVVGSKLVIAYTIGAIIYNISDLNHIVLHGRIFDTNLEIEKIDDNIFVGFNQHNSIKFYDLQLI